MKIKVISYSLSGNNEALAKSITAAFSGEHFKITESKPRTLFTIILDVLLKRTPRINPFPDNFSDQIEESDLIIFVGPVWFGQIATPFRACLSTLKAKLGRYAFVSISGGAAGPNPKLSSELKNRIGKEPEALINLYVADLLPRGLKPTIKITSAYRLKDNDVKNLTEKAVKVLREIIAKKV